LPWNEDAIITDKKNGLDKARKHGKKIWYDGEEMTIQLSLNPIDEEPPDYILETADHEHIKVNLLNTKLSYFEPGTLRPNFFDDKDEEEEEEEHTFEIIDDHSGIKDMSHRCTPGVTSWLIPRDLSSTIHICPALLKMTQNDAAIYLLDSVVRFEKVAGAIDYVLGDSAAHDLAQKHDTEISFKNAGNYSLFARKLYDTENVLVNADV
jgi:hypothetical protein